MIGRNIPSLVLKLTTLMNKKYRHQTLDSPTQLFSMIILIITAIGGVVCGISLLFPDLIYPYYLFIVICGMMIYSYFTYAGICIEDRNWIMFGISVSVILFTCVLVSIWCFQLANGKLLPFQ